MLNSLFWTKLKLPLLTKRKENYLDKMNRAFFKVRKEIIDYIKEIDTEPSIFIKYLSNCIGTDDLPTFIRILEGVIEDAKHAEGDPEAVFAIRFCKYAIFRIHWLSNFTMQWTDITVKCSHCNNIIKTNFCYTDKVCPICGAILLKSKEISNK